MTRAIVLLLTLAVLQTSGANAAVPEQAPEFTHHRAADWLNSAPLTLESLRGRVVLVEFWTYDCINCRRTLPWLKAVHDRYGGQGLVIVGVHSPEFAHEREADKVRAAVLRFGIQYAVMLDNDFSYWKAFGNRFWPAFYLLDRQGRVEMSIFGELHAGTARGDQVDKEIQRLLARRE